MGCVVHVVADIGDTAGVMLLFPFSTASFTLQAVGLRRDSGGGKYLDAAAYYSSFGMVADVVWLLALLLLSWRALTRDHWRAEVVPAEPHLWAPARRRSCPSGRLLALYRGLFFFGLCRMIAWTLWARVLADPDRGSVPARPHRRGARGG